MALLEFGVECGYANDSRLPRRTLQQASIYFFWSVADVSTSVLVSEGRLSFRIYYVFTMPAHAA